MVDSIKLIIKQTILNLKTVFSNKVNLILIFTMLLMATSISLIFIPFFAGAGVIIVISILPVSGIVYGSINYSLRKSTLSSNIELTKNNRWLFYIATVITMIIFSSILVEVLYFVLLIFNNTNLLLGNWMTRVVFADGEIVYKFSIQLNLLFLYIAFLTTTMTFAISFMFQRLVPTQNSYTILIMIFVILSVIFGGALNQYWYPANIGAYRLEDHLILFPWDVYWISMFFPYFAMGSLGQMGATASQVMVNGQTTYGQLDLIGNTFSSYFDINPNTGELFHKTMLGFFSLKNDPLWVFLMFTPYIEMIIFFIIGLSISRVFRK